MGRFILRYTGSGSAPDADLAAVRRAGASVVDENGRMLLVEATRATVDRMMRTLPDWVAAPERVLPRPRTRPTVAARSHR